MKHALAETMVRDPRLPLISFTGSVPVGRHVASLVGQRLGRTLLELSGNNAVIVDESADLDLAVRAIVFGAVGTAGQRCTTTRRLLVHESRAEELLDRLVKVYKQVRIGNPLEPDVLLGRSSITSPSKPIVPPSMRSKRKVATSSTAVAS